MTTPGESNYLDIGLEPVIRNEGRTAPEYDPIAANSKTYALSFPFIEVGLGLLFLTGLLMDFALIITAVITGVGAVGVYLKLRQPARIRCACLGTTLNFPLSKVTLAENMLMFVMAFAMLLAPATAISQHRHAVQPSSWATTTSLHQPRPFSST